jgi:hypothetical protein
MPLYFAYGANMDVAAMARRCPRSRALGTARLMRHRFVVMPGGWGSVTRDPRQSVHGVLWDLAAADVRALDAFEEIGRGLYRKILQPVVKSSGGAVRALVYVGHGEGGEPRRAYIEDVTAAARAWALPDAYVRQIEALLPRAAPGAASAGSTAPPAPRVRPRFATPFDRWQGKT